MFRENIDSMGLFGIISSVISLDDDPTENDPDEKLSRENRFVNASKQPVSKLYAMFLQSVIPIFDSFNIFLKAVEPLIRIVNKFLLSNYKCND